MAQRCTNPDLHCVYQARKPGRPLGSSWHASQAKLILTMNGRHVSSNRLVYVIGLQIGRGGLVGSGAPFLNPSPDPGDERHEHLSTE